MNRLQPAANALSLQMTFPVQTCGRVSQLSGDPPNVAVLQYLSNALAARGIAYCFPSTSQFCAQGDIMELDLAVCPAQVDNAIAVIMGMRQLGFAAVGHCDDQMGCQVFEFAALERAQLRWLRFRVVSTFWRAGVLLLSADDLLQRRLKVGNTWIATPVAELRYLLVRTVMGAELVSSEEQRLFELIRELGRSESAVVFGHIFGRQNAALLMDGWAAHPGSLDHRQVVGALWQGFKRCPSAPIKYCTRLFERIVKGRRRPRGVSLVLLGPDGVGKSTMRKRITERVGSILPVHTVWYRPRVFGRRPGRPSHQPHASLPRSGMASLLYLLTVFLDCWVGYLIHTRAYLKRFRVVIFDRNFFDLLVDPKRYRYSGPMGLVRFLSRVVPPRDFLMLVLDASEEVMFARKQELPPHELRRQRSAYRSLSPTHSVRISTDEPVERCTEQALRALVDYLAERFAREHGGRLQAS